MFQTIYYISMIKEIQFDIYKKIKIKNKKQGFCFLISFHFEKPLLFLFLFYSSYYFEIKFMIKTPKPTQYILIFTFLFSIWTKTSSTCICKVIFSFFIWLLAFFLSSVFIMIVCFCIIILPQRSESLSQPSQSDNPFDTRSSSTFQQR